MAVRLSKNIVSSPKSISGFDLTFSKDRVYNLNEIVSNHNRKDGSNKILLHVKNDELVAKKVLNEVFRDIDIKIQSVFGSENINEKIENIIKAAFAKFPDVKNSDITNKKIVEFINLNLNNVVNNLWNSYSIEYTIELYSLNSGVLSYKVDSAELNTLFNRYYDQYAYRFKKDLENVSEGGLAISSERKAQINPSYTDYKKYLLEEEKTNQSTVGTSLYRTVINWQEYSEDDRDQNDLLEIPLDTLKNYVTRDELLDALKNASNNGIEGMLISSIEKDRIIIDGFKTEKGPAYVNYNSLENLPKFKTISGESILGSGNMDLPFVTRDFVNERYDSLESEIEKLTNDIFDMSSNSDSTGGGEVGDGKFAYIETADGEAYVITGYTGSEKELRIPNTYRGKKVVEIFDGAFIGSNIEVIDFPDSIKVIGDNAFAQSRLKNVIIPGNIEVIGTKAFAYCSQLITVEIRDGVKIIGDEAFADSSLTNIILPGSITEIGHHCFKDTKLESIDLSRTNITAINVSVFENSLIKSCLLPEGLKLIDIHAFLNCRYLKKITLPQSLTMMNSLNNCACFENCVNLKEVYFKNGRFSIKYGPFFTGCINLERIYFYQGKDKVNLSKEDLGAPYAEIIYGMSDDHMHNYVSEIIKNPTCSEVGVKTYKCTICNFEYTEDIPMIPHTEVIDPAKEPTETEPGLTEGIHCAVCGKIIVPQEKVEYNHTECVNKDDLQEILGKIEELEDKIENLKGTNEGDYVIDPDLDTILEIGEKIKELDRVPILMEVSDDD